MKKRTHRKYRAPGLHPLDRLAASAPMPPAQVDGIVLRIHDAFAHLRGGGQDWDLFDRIAVTMNVGLIRSEQIGAAGVELFKTAQDALMDAAGRLEEVGHFGFSGPGLESLREAVALYEEILKASSPLQMHRAQEEVLKRIKDGDVYCPQALIVEAHA